MAFKIHEGGNDESNPLVIAQEKLALGLNKMETPDESGSYLDDMPVLDSSDGEKPKKSWKAAALAGSLLLAGGAAAAFLLLKPVGESPAPAPSNPQASEAQPLTASAVSEFPASGAASASAPQVVTGSPFALWCKLPLEKLGSCEIPSRERLSDAAFKQMFLDSFAKDGIIQNHEKVRQSVEQMLFIRDQSDIKPDNDFVNNVYQIIRSGKPITLDEALALVEQSNKVLVAGLQNESAKMVSPQEPTVTPPTQGKIRLGSNALPVSQAKTPTKRAAPRTPQYENLGQPQTPPQFYPEPAPVYQPPAPVMAAQGDYPPTQQSPVRLTNKALVVGDMKKEVAKQNREISSVDAAVDKILSQESPKNTKQQAAKEVRQDDADSGEEKTSVFRRKTPVKKNRPQGNESGDLSEQDLRDIEEMEKALMSGD